MNTPGAIVETIFYVPARNTEQKITDLYPNWYGPLYAKLLSIGLCIRKQTMVINQGREFKDDHRYRDYH